MLRVNKETDTLNAAPTIFSLTQIERFKIEFEKALSTGNVVQIVRALNNHLRQYLDKPAKETALTILIEQNSSAYRTMLRLAAELEDHNILPFLTAKVRNGNHLALYFAMQGNHLNCADILVINARANVNEALEEAIQADDRITAERLISYFMISFELALMLAVKLNKPFFVADYIMKSDRFDSHFFMLLELARGNNNLQLGSILLDRALEVAIQKGDRERAEALITEHGLSRDLAISHAVQHAQAELIIHFHTTGANINAAQEGITLLHRAALNENIEIARLLITRGASVNQILVLNPDIILTNLTSNVELLELLSDALDDSVEDANHSSNEEPDADNTDWATPVVSTARRAHSAYASPQLTQFGPQQLTAAATPLGMSQQLSAFHIPSRQ